MSRYIRQYVSTCDLCIRTKPIRQALVGELHPLQILDSRWDTLSVDFVVELPHDMKRYYDQQKTLAPVFKPGDKVFLDASDIRTTHPSQKLSHQRLGPFVVEWQIRPMAYRLRLPHWIKQLHPVFNVVKLTLAPDDPIAGRKTEGHPPPIVIDGEPEWEVEKILDSRWHRRRFQYLIKWKGYGREHNSWEFASEVSAPELTAEFHHKHPGALRHI